MSTAFRDDHNIRYSEKDGGSVTNISDDIVLLRVPSKKELEQLYAEFEVELKSKVERLFTMTCGELYPVHGSLNTNEKFVDDRASTLYGFITRDSNTPKYINIRKGTLAIAMIDMGYVDKKTPHGKIRQRMRKGDGSIAHIVERMPIEEQIAILRHLIQNYDLDDYLVLEQSSRAIVAGTRDFILRCKTSQQALDQIASWTRAHVLEPLDRRAERGFTGKGSGYDFAPVWFAQFLARKGVWLLPIRWISEVRRFYPAKLRPLLAWMSVDDDCRDIADAVCALERSSKQHTSLKVCLNVFAAAALSSDIFSTRRFCPAPLERMRDAFHHHGNVWQRGALNEVYRLLATMFNVDVSNRPEAAKFYKRKRMDAAEEVGFKWMSSPTTKNTQRAARLLKGPIESVPAIIQEWGRLFDEVMPLIAVKTKDQVIQSLNLWPTYLLTLPEDEIPRSFAQIDRYRHINSLDKQHKTFVNFLEESGLPRDKKQRAIAQMSRAWELSATLHGFRGKAANPFDTKFDVPKEPRAKGRRGKTARSAMDFDAFFVILDENRRNYYEFARSIERYTKRLLNPFSGVVEDVFWPIEATCIDVILCSGSRNLDARWIDSGECDEMAVDLDGKIEVPNHLPSAIAGRRAGFLRVIPTNDPREPNLVGLYKLSNKTGDFHEFPYVPAELAVNVQRLARQQALYNPIRKPVLLVDIKHKSRYLDESLYETACPVFRPVDDPLQVAVSEERLRSYWYSLLVHCQPLVDAALGYHYPLTRDGKAIFDIHSLRVTLVTYLLEKDVDIDTVRRFAGHSSAAMAVYYNAVRARALNKSVADAFARNDDGVLESAIQGHVDALKVLAEESFEARVDRRATAGVERLREMAEGTRSLVLDYFRHGLCAAGDCNTGGEPIDGRPQPVWRPRACSSCMFRVTGPRFLRGLIERTNMLALEINDSFERTEAFNRRMAEIEASTGKIDYKLRQAKDVEDRLRDHLCHEWVIEAQTTFIMERIARQELAGRDASEGATVRGGKYEIDPNLLSLGLGDMDGFELLQMVMKHAIDDPTSELDGSAERAREHVRKLKRMFRNNELEDMMYRIPEDDDAEHFMRHTDVLVGMFGGSKVREFMARSEDFERSPELADSTVLQKLSAKFQPRGIADAAV